MATRRQLPLFPLNSVLLPGSVIPLQIFEPRYQRMLRDCLDGDRRFGVVLIRSGPEVGGTALTHEVGTVARILQTNDIGGGRHFLSARGEQRFRLIHRFSDDPYPSGEIESMPDEPGEDDLESLAESVREDSLKLLNLLVGLGGGWIRRRELPFSPELLSYRVPGLLRLDPADKQRLLEAETTGARLRAEAALLRSQLDSLRPRLASEFRGRFSAN